MTSRRGYADTRHGQVHYQTAGAGPPLVLLHATPRSSRSFARLIPFLAERYRVIAPDTLGFGQSDPLPPGATMEKLAEGMVDLLDALDIETAAVFGLHTGNKVGAALAAGWPDRIRKFILCGMTHSIILDEEKREAAIKEIVAANPMDIDKPVAHPSEKLDRIQAAASFDGIYAANYAFDLAAALARLAVPTLVIELATPAEAHLGEQAGSLAELIPQCTTVILQRSDRDVLERVPEELADAIATFL